MEVSVVRCSAGTIPHSDAPVEDAVDNPAEEITEDLPGLLFMFLCNYKVLRNSMKCEIARIAFNVEETI